MKKKCLLTLVVLGVLTATNFCTTGALVASASSEDSKYCNTGGGFVEQSETIVYANKTTEEFTISGKVPNYAPHNFTTGCANVAGSIIISYYDRFCEELIPNYTTYMKLGSAIMYKSGGVETDAVTDTLYNLMGTDVGGGGTTFNGFQGGMKSYVNSHGYSYSTENVGTVDLGKYIAAVKSNKPVAIFLSNYSLKLAGEDSGTVEVIKSKHSEVAHVVVGCGYKVDYYYNSANALIATRTYLRVASGHVTTGITYLCLDGKSKVDEAVAVHIS